MAKISMEGLVKAGILWGGTAMAVNYAPEAVSTAINTVYWTGAWIIAWTKTLVANVLGTSAWATVWSLAPFAMPVVWGLIWHKMKLWDAFKIENDFMRKAVNLTGTLGWAAIWAGFSSTLLPRAVMWGAGYVLYKWTKKVWQKIWLINK